MRKEQIRWILFMLSVSFLIFGLIARGNYENGSRGRHASAMSGDPGNEYGEAFVTLKAPFDRTMQAPHIYCDYGGSYALYPVIDCTGKKGTAVTVMYAYDDDRVYGIWESVRAALDAKSLSGSHLDAGKRVGYSLKGTLISPGTLFSDGAYGLYRADMLRQWEHLRDDIRETLCLLEPGSGYDSDALILVVREEGNIHLFPAWASIASFLMSFILMAASALMTLSAGRERRNGR